MTPDILTAQQAMRFVPGLPMVFATSDGELLSYGVRPIKQLRAKDGYRRVHVFVEPGVRKTFSVHRLIAMAWCDGYAPGLMVNHKDGVKDNNHASNLEWVTAAENNAHSVRNGLRRTKYPPDVVQAMRRMRESGVALADIAAATGASIGFVCDVVNNKTCKPPEQWKAGCHAK